MANLTGFDANQHEPLGDFEALPAGDYLAMIVSSELKPTKDKTGEFLELKWEILEGDYKGRNLWSRLNLSNKSAKAVEIAQRELSSICRAVKCMTPKDSQDLHNIPCIVKVKCKKREDNGEISNEIKGYEEKGKPSSGSRQTSDTSNASTPPWKK